MARNLEQLQKQYQSTTANGKMGGGPRGRGHGGMPGGKPKDTKQTVKRLFGYVGGYKYHFIVVFINYCSRL